MADGKRKSPVEQRPLDPLIFAVRGHRVALDSDLAQLYGVTTKRFNEAFKRNRSRFPDDFAFQLTDAEFADLRSQIATSSSQPNDFQGIDARWSQIVTSSHGGRRHRPWGFTEHGALMAANVLRSQRAAKVSVYVIRAFVRLREGLAADTAILKLAART